MMVQFSSSSVISAPISISSSSFSTVSIYSHAPAIATTSTSISPLTLRTHCLILRPPSYHSLPAKPISRNTLTCSVRDSHTQNYVYPHPNPQFAEFETQRFKVELLRKLSKDAEEFGDDLHAVVDVCAQLFNEFLRKEYGGPGTLLVEPFTDMYVALKKKKLPGSPLATRASLLWAQNNVDEDWELWNSNQK